MADLVSVLDERPLDRLFIEAFILSPTIQSEVKAESIFCFS